ncbi:MAG: hypothetical protein B6I20_14315 [Bacteroidetes bacterium 4572_117]|nr:MAG: hypothetical protein B6I20_14315 [Bacteroidetes bacterium 4572_117]
MFLKFLFFMQTIKVKQIFYKLILGFIIILQSCIEKVDYDQIATPEPKLVVNSYITPDSLMEFFVHKTSGMVDTNIYIKTGNIKVWEDDVLLATLTEHKNGHFVLPIKPKVNSKYKIVVNADDMQVSAQTSIPVPTKITGFTSIYPVGWEDQISYGPYAKFFITIDDQIINNYYELVILGYKTSLIYKKGYVLSDNAIIKAEGDNYTNQKLMFSDKMFNGQKIVFDFDAFEIINEFVIEKILIVLHTVTAEYYMYHKTLAEHYYNQGLISF